MATLSDEQLRRITRAVQQDPASANINLKRQEAYALIQSIETHFEDVVKAALVAPMDTAASPGTVTAGERMLFFKHFLPVKFELD